MEFFAEEVKLLSQAENALQSNRLISFNFDRTCGVIRGAPVHRIHIHSDCRNRHYSVCQDVRCVVSAALRVIVFLYEISTTCRSRFHSNHSIVGSAITNRVCLVPVQELTSILR